MTPSSILLAAMKVAPYWVAGTDGVKRIPIGGGNYVNIHPKKPTVPVESSNTN